MVKKIKLSTTLLLALSISLAGYSQKKIKDKPLKTLDSLVIDMSVNEGLINTYQNKKNELYFEITKDLLKKELLEIRL